LARFLGITDTNISSMIENNAQLLYGSAVSCHYYQYVVWFMYDELI